MNQECFVLDWTYRRETVILKICWSGFWQIVEFWLQNTLQVCYKETTSRCSLHICTGRSYRIADRAQACNREFRILGAYIGRPPPVWLTNFTSRLMSKSVSVSAPHRHHRLLCDTPVFQPSATELFRSRAARCLPAVEHSAEERRHGKREGVLNCPHN